MRSKKTYTTKPRRRIKQETFLERSILNKLIKVDVSRIELETFTKEMLTK